MRIPQRRKPKQRRSEATVEFVLAAAAQILEEEGLGAFNTNAVAQRAGISIGSLYQYFPNKDAILAAMILHIHQGIVSTQRSVLAATEGMSAGFALSALMRALIEVQSHSPKLARILEMEEMRLPRSPELAALEAEIEAMNREFFGRYVDCARCSPQQLDNAAADTICIVRSLLDAAAISNTLDAPDLHERLYRTIEGYLGPLLPRDT